MLGIENLCWRNDRVASQQGEWRLAVFRERVRKHEWVPRLEFANNFTTVGAMDSAADRNVQSVGDKTNRAIS